MGRRNWNREFLSISLVISAPAFAVNNIKSNVIENSYIVVLDQGGDSAKNLKRKSNLRDRAFRVLDGKRISRTRAKKFFTEVVGGFSAELTELDAVELRKDPSILQIEEEKTYSITQTLTCPMPVTQPSQSVGWGARRIGYGPGTGKVAWVVDTGVDLCYPDLNVDVARSRSFVDSSKGQDGHGHGTHVAGVIGAKNNTIGVRGIASITKIVAIKVLSDTGSSTGSSLLSGLDYVYQNVKAGEVVNLSLGGGTSQIMDDAVRRIAAKGAWVVIAAGNSAQDSVKFSPARVNGTRLYTISAFASGDALTSWSNFGSSPVDYALPGNNILSTFKGGSYSYMNGTSMAAPHMAGLLLLTNGAVRLGGYVTNDPDGVPDPIAVR